MTHFCRTMNLHWESSVLMKADFSVLFTCHTLETRWDFRLSCTHSRKHNFKRQYSFILLFLGWGYGRVHACATTSGGTLDSFSMFLVSTHRHVRSCKGHPTLTTKSHSILVKVTYYFIVFAASQKVTWNLVTFEILERNPPSLHFASLLANGEYNSNNWRKSLWLAVSSHHTGQVDNWRVWRNVWETVVVLRSMKGTTVQRRVSH